MKSVSIASGSKGNCLYVKSQDTSILVDIGLTCSLLEEKLKLIDVDPKSINAIVVTHEHVDHCKGIGVFARKYGRLVDFELIFFRWMLLKLG